MLGDRTDSRPESRRGDEDGRHEEGPRVVVRGCVIGMASRTGWPE
jgi:hypothetical protein